MSGGSASTSTSWSSTGYQYISAAYSGDTNYQPENSASLQIDVVTAATPMVATSNQPQQAVSGTPFTVSVSVAQTAAGPVPTGTVSAQTAGTSLGQGALSGNPASASLTLNTSTQPIPVGAQTISYCYSGSAPWLATCTAETIAVTGTTSLSIAYSGSSTISSGSPITITGQLTANQSGVAPTGTVSLLDDGKTIASSTLSGSSPFALSFTVNTSAAPFAAGSNVLSLSYSGDANWAASTSGTVTLTVNSTASVSLTSNLPSSLEALSGAAITFTATVTPLGNATAPTGTVQFYDGSTAIGAPVPLSGGAASYSSTTFATGQHSVTAHYSGDSNYSAEVGGPIAFTVVTQGQTSLSFTLVRASQTIIRVTSFQIDVYLSESTSIAGPAPTGTITVTNNGTVVASAPVNPGASEQTIYVNLDGPGFTLGSNSMSISYSGDSNWAASSQSQTYTMAQGQPAFSSFNCFGTPFTVGSTITCTADFSWSYPGGPTPTGVISLLDNGTSIGTANIIGSSPLSVSISVNTGPSNPLASGTQTFSLSYPGDVSWMSAQSTVLSVTVNPAVPTFTITSSLGSYGSVVAGTAVTFTATATSSAAGTPAGTVQFYIDGTAAGSPVTMSGGVATYTTSSLGTGQHTITAAYSGSSYYSGATTNGIVTVVTQGGDSIVMSLPAAATVPLGTPITVSGTVTPAALGPAPSGTVTLMDGATPLATASLSGSWPANVSFTVDTASAPLAAGAHSFSLQYGGAAQWAASASSSAAVSITQAVTTTTVTSSAATIASGSSVTAPAPTGTVQFYDASTALGSPVALSSNTATYATTSLAGGAHSITAVYSGDANFATSTSAAFTETVEAIALVANVSSQSVTPGSSATYTFTLTGEGETESTAFTCSGLPSESTCTFSPSTVSGSGTTTMTIATTASTQALANPATMKLWTARGGAVFACAVFFLLPRRRRMQGLFLVLLAILPALSTGCAGGNNSGGGGGNSGTPAGNYTVTVTATAGSGSSAITQTATVTLTVQ